MKTIRDHRITETGQIIQRTVTEQIVTNPADIFSQLLATEIPAESSSDDPSIRSLYHLGDGVSAFRQKIGSFMYYWNSIQLEAIPFYLQWELQQDPLVNDGKHFLCPWDGQATGNFSINAPITMPIPEDLIVHFHVEYKKDPASLDIQLPEARNLPNVAFELTKRISNFYLTCFSQSRNTCLNLPLPNLYPDCRLCTGTAFETPGFFNPSNHAGLTTSIRHFLKAWADTAWNLDLLDGANSIKMAQFRRFIRFDADSGAPLEFSGCHDWDIATSTVPLEKVYLPWRQDSQAVQPQRRAEDADRIDATETLENAAPAPATEVF